MIELRFTIFVFGAFAASKSQNLSKQPEPKPEKIEKKTKKVEEKVRKCGKVKRRRSGRSHRKVVDVDKVSLRPGVLGCRAEVR